MGGERARPTISSLQMGHTSRFEAAAAATALSPDPSRTFVPMSSLLDVCELSETELTEGESRLALRRWAGEAAGDAAAWGDSGCVDDDGTAGERCRPLPSTRPPPRDLREVMDGKMGVVDKSPASPSWPVAVTMEPLR
jgi:hypothetical protein